MAAPLILKTIFPIGRATPHWIPGSQKSRKGTTCAPKASTLKYGSKTCRPLNQYLMPTFLSNPSIRVIGEPMSFSTTSTTYLINPPVLRPSNLSSSRRMLSVSVQSLLAFKQAHIQSPSLSRKASPTKRHLTMLYPALPGKLRPPQSVHQPPPHSPIPSMPMSCLRNVHSSTGLWRFILPRGRRALSMGPFKLRGMGVVSSQVSLNKVQQALLTPKRDQRGQFCSGSP